MSRGPGRIERALRWRIGLSKRMLFQPERFTSEQLLIAAIMHRPPYTASERRSVLRAMHRIIEGSQDGARTSGKAMCRWRRE